MSLHLELIIYVFSCSFSVEALQPKVVTSVAIHLNLLVANVNVTIGTLSKPSLYCSNVKDKVRPRKRLSNLH